MSIPLNQGDFSPGVELSFYPAALGKLRKMFVTIVLLQQKWAEEFTFTTIIPVEHDYLREKEATF